MIDEITLGSLFDGIGVFPLASSRYGIKPLWASEVAKAPVSITKRHFPNMEHLGDITKLDGGAIPPVDVITFGSPCQNLSNQGDRSGLAGSKSSLFYEAIRIIQEMRCATDNRYPTFVVWENVAGALWSNNRLDYRAVLSSLAGTEVPMPADGRWATAGMVCGGNVEIAWRLLDSLHFYSAQRRQRVFVVADYRGQRAAQILFDPAPLHEILEYGEESGVPDASDGRGDIDKTGRHPPEIYSLQTRKMRGGVQYRDARMFLAGVGEPNRPCPTLLATDPQLIVIHYPDEQERDHIRRLTPREYERLMCVPEGWTEIGCNGEQISDTARYMALGNAIVLPCAEYIMAGIAKALADNLKEDKD